MSKELTAAQKKDIEISKQNYNDLTEQHKKQVNGAAKKKNFKNFLGILIARRALKLVVKLFDSPTEAKANGTAFFAWVTNLFKVFAMSEPDKKDVVEKAIDHINEDSLFNESEYNQAVEDLHSLENVEAAINAMHTSLTEAVEKKPPAGKSQSI